MLTRMFSLMVMGLTVMATCAPQSAMAAPLAASTPLYTRGHAPRLPMELLPEQAVVVSPALGRAEALKLLRERAASVGADAVVDVVVETLEMASPSGVTMLPNILLGTLMSVVTWSPDPLVSVTQSELQGQLVRKVLRVRGTPVKFFR